MDMGNQTQFTVISLLKEQQERDSELLDGINEHHLFSQRMNPSRKYSYSSLVKQKFASESQWEFYKNHGELPYVGQIDRHAILSTRGNLPMSTNHIDQISNPSTALKPIVGLNNKEKDFILNRQSMANPKLTNEYFRNPSVMSSNHPPESPLNK
jgi:hypothetical protein